MKSLWVLLALAVISGNALAQGVTLDSGKLEGTRLGVVDRYLGIPYAAPPVGAWRWRAPQPVQPWKGVRSAKTAGSACSQYGHFITGNDPAAFDQPYGSEDCLYLNVWTPVEPAAKPRPVFIFIHGGSGMFGDSAHPLYDGARLAQESGMVVISANYRLGIFGGLQLPVLKHGDPAEDSGSYFLLDLIRVLDWTRANAAAFGGDPGNITLSGHSAGAVNALALLRSPLARGKFQRLVSLSGLPFSASAARAEERSRKLLLALMLKDGSIKAEIELDARMKQLGDHGLGEYLYCKTREELLAAGPASFAPAQLADGMVLPRQAEPDELAMGIESRVPVMIGTTRDELTTLTPLKRHAFTAGERWPLINGEPRGQTLFDMLGWWDTLRFKASVLAGDFFIRRQAHGFYDALAPQTPAVYAYQFNWDDFPEPWRSEMGSFHGLDVPFLFGNFLADKPTYMRFAWTEASRAHREDMHRRMVTALKNFAERGDPNDGKDINWPKWDGQQRLQVWE